jgi:hypothetical protein
MTYAQLIEALQTNMTAPVTDSFLIAENDQLVLDYLLAQNADDFPDWAAGLTFQTNGSDDGKYCKHPDANGKKRIFETKTNNNTGNTPPTDPLVSENTHWLEISQSAGSAIREYAPGVYGNGLQIVYHNHSTLGRGLYLLLDPVRPYTSTNIETETGTGKWERFTINQAQLDTKQSTSQKGAANGYAGLDGSGRVPAAQLPAYVDDVLEFANLAAFPVTGETGKIYLALDTNFTYRWSGSTYILLTSQPSDASETVKGVVEEGTDAEVQNAGNTGTGGTGARLFVSIPKLWAWWTYIRTQSYTIAGLWNFTTSPTVPTASAGDSTTKVASTAFVTTADNFKLNKGANPEFESLPDTSDDYGIAFLSRVGAVFKSSSVRWNESLKQLRVIGTQAIWSAVAGVTDGNMGVKALQAAVESFKIFDNTGNFFSVGTESGLRSTRIFTALQLRNGIARNETEFKAVSVAASATQLLKTISIPNDTILTVDLYNIAVMNQDEDYMFGFSQMSFYNNGGAVIEISRDELKYGRIWSSIKGTDGYLISTDTRFSASILGTDVSINFVNTEAKLVSVNCELKYTIVNKPS